MKDDKSPDSEMADSRKDVCARCGAVIPAASADRVCPACLLSGAMGHEGETQTVLMRGEEVPKQSIPSDFPCDFGDYRLLGLLGSGGMGAVYEAEHIATGRRVGLKMLNHRLDSPDMRQRFLREGRLAAAVSHPNSLYVFGSEEIEGRPVITMELAAGGTLKDRLDRQGPFPVAEAVDAILDVITGLEAAFNGGVLHRDVKPSNCFVNADGSVMVGDFGLSVSTIGQGSSFVTATGIIMGTPAYASPEQLLGDDLDARADIYSAGATLYTLLTGRAPFEGQNAVQVVANAVNQKPLPVTQLRKDLPPGLDRVVARCLAKDPGQRYANYAALRNALLPFSSRKAEPASMKLRASAGWMDFLIAFLTPYVPLMLLAGAENFHIRPFMDPSLYAFRYYLAWLCCGCLYFGIVEGIWGAGPGKRLKGLRVVTPKGGRPGVWRALIRILAIMVPIELVRFPVTLALFAMAEPGQISGFHVLTYNIAINVCPWITVLFAVRARRENGFAALWDRVSGTRVVIKPEDVDRPAIDPETTPATPESPAEFAGPFQILEVVVPERWMVAIDPVLQRRVWLLHRGEDGNGPSRARQQVARRGRLRWLQSVGKAGQTWDAFEATPGKPLSSLVRDGQSIPWSTMRYWLHDLASEMLEATRDNTLPESLSIENVWISSRGQAILLDESWPSSTSQAEAVSVGELTGQQRFLAGIAAHADSTRLPLHARGVLKNLNNARFEKLSFLTGVLSGLLNKPSELGKGLRAGSIFMLPIYVWILVVIGTNAGSWLTAMAAAWILMVLRSLFQLLELPFRTTCSHAVFRLVVLDSLGERAGWRTLLRRWAITWLPLFVTGSIAAFLWARDFTSAAQTIGYLAFALWVGAAIHTVFHPYRGLHDRLAGTRVVRR